MMAGMTVIVRTISRLIFGLMFLFGIYIVIHGHLTPGGGFAGGTLIAASAVMLILAYGADFIRDRIGALDPKFMESVGGVILISVGIIGILMGIAFYGHVFPVGTAGDLFSASNLPLLNIAVGIEVATGIFVIFYAMLLKEEK